MAVGSGAEGTVTVTVMPNVNPMVWMALRRITTRPDGNLATMQGSHRERHGWHRPSVLVRTCRPVHDSQPPALAQRSHPSRLPSMTHRL